MSRVYDSEPYMVTNIHKALSAYLKHHFLVKMNNYSGSLLQSSGQDPFPTTATQTWDSGDNPVKLKTAAGLGGGGPM